MLREPAASGVRAGSQTLARGLTALMTIIDSGNGLTVQQIAEQLGVHRTIAYRLLQTLASFGLVAPGADGIYRPGARLATLADSYLPALREASLPVMREVADELGCTVSMFVAERSEAVSIALVEPTTASWHLRFKVGMRTPLDRGAAGYALLAAGPKQPDEPAMVTRARRRGFATSHGEVEPGAYAVAAAVPNSEPRTCLNLITYREDQAKAAEKHIRAAAKRLGSVLHLADAAQAPNAR